MHPEPRKPLAVLSPGGRLGVGIASCNYFMEQADRPAAIQRQAAERNVRDAMKGAENDLLKTGLFRSVKATQENETVDFVDDISSLEHKPRALELARTFSPLNPSGITITIFVHGQKRYELDYSASQGFKADRIF